MEHEPGTASRSPAGLADRLKRDSKQKVEHTKRTAADHISEIARALDRARAQLEPAEPTLAAYAGQVADGVGNLATRLRERSLDELLEDARQLARRNPALYLGGAAALGFVLARFLKASASETAAYADPAGSSAPTLDLDAATGTAAQAGLAAAAARTAGG